MAQLTIRRASQFVGLLGGYPIQVDGETVARISDGQAVTIELQPGRREIIAKRFGVRSNPVQIDVVPEGQYRLELGSRLSGWVSLFILGWPFFPRVTGWVWPSGIPLPVTFGVGPSLIVVIFVLRMGTRTLYLREEPGPTPLNFGGTREDESPTSEPGMPFPIRLLMLAMAGLAVLLGIDVELARSYKQSHFRSRAAVSAQMAAFWRERQRSFEASAASSGSRGNNRAGASIRATAAKAGARAAYYEDLNRKYTRAASERWRSVEPDPPEPPFP